MRKPRDFDAELKALDAKAKHLRQRKLMQLGELVVVTGADALPIEELAGALIEAAGTDEFVTKEAWRRRGAAFFRGTSKASRSVHGNSNGDAAPGRSSPSASGAESA